MLAIGAERLVWPFFSLYVLEMGGSTSTIALINALGSIASVLVAPIGGYIADYKGRVRLLGLGTLAYSLCSIFFILARNWFALAVGIFIQMLTRIYMPALDAVLADSTSTGKRGREYAFSDAISTVPSIFAPVLIGLLADRFSIIYAVRIGFAGLLVFGSIAALIRLTLEETVVGDKKTATMREIPRFIYDSYKEMFLSLKRGQSNLKVIIIICVLISVFNSAVCPYWIVYAKEVIRITPAEWGIIISVGSFLRIMLLVPAGFLVDRIGSKKAILISLLPLPLCAMLFINSHSFISTFLSINLITLCNILSAPASSALFADSTAKSSRGSVVAAISRGRMGLVLGSGVLSGAVLLLPAKLIGYKIGDMLYREDPTFPWLFLSIGLVLILILAAVSIKGSRNRWQDSQVDTSAN